MNELDSLVESARQLFAQSATPADLENAKAQFLGKSGRVTELMKGMAQLSVEEKKSRGAAINVTKQAIEAALTARRQALQEAELQAQLKAEALDVTLPGRQRGQRTVPAGEERTHPGLRESPIGKAAPGEVDAATQQKPQEKQGFRVGRRDGRCTVGDCAAADKTRQAC